jgi:hypothetical protein
LSTISLAGWPGPYDRGMHTLRRAFIALGVTAVAATIVRLRGTGGTPPRRGGWREIPASELT